MRDHTPSVTPKDIYLKRKRTSNMNHLKNKRLRRLLLKTRNFVAKHMHKVCRAVTHKDKTKYNRKKKHKYKE